MSYSLQFCPLPGILYIIQLKLKVALKFYLEYYQACVYVLLHQNKGQGTNPVGSIYGEDNLWSVFSELSPLPSLQLYSEANVFHTWEERLWGGKGRVYKEVSQK